MVHRLSSSYRTFSVLYRGCILTASVRYIQYVIQKELARLNNFLLERMLQTQTQFPLAFDIRMLCLQSYIRTHIHTYTHTHTHTHTYTTCILHFHWDNKRGCCHENVNNSALTLIMRIGMTYGILKAALYNKRDICYGRNKRHLSFDLGPAASSSGSSHNVINSSKWTA
jgi:hypothetical protein